MNKAIVIAGPTGVGKTKISIDLANELNAEIISSDSAQVYRGLNIGTAKNNRRRNARNKTSFNRYCKTSIKI